MITIEKTKSARWTRWDDKKSTNEHFAVRVVEGLIDHVTVGNVVVHHDTRLGLGGTRTRHRDQALHEVSGLAGNGRGRPTKLVRVGSALGGILQEKSVVDLFEGLVDSGGKRAIVPPTEREDEETGERRRMTSRKVGLGRCQLS